MLLGVICLEDFTAMNVLKQWLQLGGLSREHLVSVCILSDVMSNSPSSNVNCGLVVQINDMRAKNSCPFTALLNIHCFVGTN